MIYPVIDLDIVYEDEDVMIVNTTKIGCIRGFLTDQNLRINTCMTLLMLSLLIILS